MGPLGPVAVRAPKRQCPGKLAWPKASVERWYLSGIQPQLLLVQRFWRAARKDPTDFQRMKVPVCPLRRSLYGHKLAGFLWQNHAEDIIINKLESDKLLSWECLYFHRQNSFFFTVYVDDFKITGKNGNIKPMWGEMTKFMLLVVES